MNITIERDSPTPASQQIYDQLRAMVAARSLAPGHQLPTIRQLAGDLDVAPGTVARAYRDLDAASITESRGRHGTFVSQGATIDRSSEISKAAREFAVRLTQLGASRAEAMQQAKRAFDQLIPGDN